MKTFEDKDLDPFLELPLVASSFLEVEREYTCIHDDNDGNPDQCLKITLKKDSLDNEVFHINTPTSPGLRFRNYAGGGSSLPVHNALKVLIYASFNCELLLPGLERKNPRKYKISKEIEEILDGVIGLPAQVLTKENNSPHWFFEINPCWTVAISVDGDTHILTKQTTDFSEQIKGESTYWNPEDITF